MDRIKGHIVEVLSADTVLVEVEFIGRFNAKNLPPTVKVRFSALTPPYTRNVPPLEREAVLNNKLLGQYVSANVGAPDLDGVFSGKIACEGPYYRNKKKFL